VGLNIDRCINVEPALREGKINIKNYWTMDEKNDDPSHT